MALIKAVIGADSQPTMALGRRPIGMRATFSMLSGSALHIVCHRMHAMSSIKGPSHLCNACLGALGYPAQKISEIASYMRVTRTFRTKKSVVQHQNFDGFDLRAANGGCQLCRRRYGSLVSRLMVWGGRRTFGSCSGGTRQRGHGGLAGGRAMPD